MRYSHRQIETKWQQYWLTCQTFSIDLQAQTGPKFYVLDMFPYPSGKGLHVGHLRGYVATDVIARMKRMQQYQVFHPIGFDSFGLPAEQYALKTGNDPAPFTDVNIANFLHQLQALGFAYDYRKVIKTSDPRYYRWTQWIFQQFWQTDLAYQAKVAVNYCPALNTVLANEEVVKVDNHLVSERGHFPVFRRYTKQWLLAIVKYAPQLLNQLPQLDWPSAIKQAQTNWIGAQSGYEITVTIQSATQPTATTTLKVFTTYLRDWQTSQFLLVALDCQQLDQLVTPTVLAKLTQLRQTFQQTALRFDAQQLQQPLGLNSGCYLINPVTQQRQPVYFAQLVEVAAANSTQLGVTQFDWRIWHFAKYHQLVSTTKLTSQQPGTVSAATSGVTNAQFLMQFPQLNFQFRTYYRLRNWVFSRQRYWGEPFPLRHLANGKLDLIPESALPLQLPAFQLVPTTETGLSPLARVASWVQAGYDPNVMPQWAGSCWYYLAFLLMKPDGSFWPLNSVTGQQILNRWMPVDLYIGGQEHAVSHLLYARFWNHFLAEQLPLYRHLEPFQKLVNQGLILGPDQKKMSKSRGNVVDPMQYLVSHGADALRLYIQFMGPFPAKISWDEHNLDAMRKWLARVYTLFVERPDRWIAANDQRLDKLLHTTIKAVTIAYDKQQFNVAIAKLMTFINACYKQSTVYRPYGLIFLQLLNPLCPHLTEEIWALWKQPGLLADSVWPVWQPQYLNSALVPFALQINGKTKRVLELTPNLTQAQVLAHAQTLKLVWWPTNYRKIIFIPNKILNFVI